MLYCKKAQESRRRGLRRRLIWKAKSIMIVGDVCVYVCMYTNMYIYVYVYICIYMYIYVYTHMFVCIHVCEPKYICTCIYIGAEASEIG